MGAESPSRVAVVLAAGKGTRMRSELPKVVHEAAGRPLLAWVLDAARAASCRRLLVVVGHGAEAVREALGGADVEWIEQREQLGTGHALAQAEGRLAEPQTVLVLSGDVPLVTAATLTRLLEAAAGSWGAMAVARLAEPGSLGRVVPRAGGALERIVEAADAGPEELALDTVNAGIYALPAPQIFARLAELTPDNAKGELYLTDALNAVAAAGERIALVELGDPDEALGVNTRGDLARVHRALLDRKAAALADAGVTLLEPARTGIEPRVEVGADTVVHADVSLSGETVVGRGCTLGQGVWVRDSKLGDGAVVEPYSVIDGADVGPGCRVGPFARLRPGATLGRGSKIGNFVEVKNSRLGDGVKANHLSYLGDATVGDGANIGAGTVTCNYDGFAKHRTEIGGGASIGSDTMLVAPVSVGENAETAAGSVITADVPPGALGVGRAKQRNVGGWTERRRRGRKEKR